MLVCRKIALLIGKNVENDKAPPITPGGHAQVTKSRKPLGGWARAKLSRLQTNRYRLLKLQGVPHELKDKSIS